MTDTPPPGLGSAATQDKKWVLVREQIPIADFSKAGLLRVVEAILDQPYVQRLELENVRPYAIMERYVRAEEVSDTMMPLEDTPPEPEAEFEGDHAADEALPLYALVRSGEVDLIPPDVLLNEEAGPVEVGGTVSRVLGDYGAEISRILVPDMETYRGVCREGKLSLPWDRVEVSSDLSADTMIVLGGPSEDCPRSQLTTAVRICSDFKPPPERAEDGVEEGEDGPPLFL